MLDKNDLQAIQEMMQASLQSNLQAINERLDTMQDDIKLLNQCKDTKERC